jgi:SulP family sulfate permease
MRALILSLEAVPVIDVTGLVALESAISRLRQQGVLTLIAGARPQPLSVLQRAGVREEPGKLQFCANLEEAVRVAAEHTGEVTPAGRPPPFPAAP